MDKFKEFWPLLKEWYEDDPRTIVDWMVDFYKDPEVALFELKAMNDEYLEDTKETGVNDKKI